MFRLPTLSNQTTEPHIVAAVDLGSNSFHMIVARIAHGQVHVIDRIKEMVRLGGGLDEQRRLTPESRQRALECLARFGQRLRDIPLENVRVVGTNVLRAAKNADNFVDDIEKVLGHRVEIISGREEARLIYLGVAHTLAGNAEKRLVIDIGGGSTEFIIGEKFEPLCAESLTMGCVSMSRQFFGDGILRAKNMRRAEIATLLELQPIEAPFRKMGWDKVIGSSGTLRNVQRVIQQMGWGNEITQTNLQQLRQAILDAGHINELVKLKGLNPERAAVIAGGVAVISGIFEGFKLQQMSISEGALREGLVYDMLGRIQHTDVREHTIQMLIHRYQIDITQAERVENTALHCLTEVAPIWDLNKEEYMQILSWAARLHEIGLSISHEHYHKHGAYLLEHSDLAGFSRQEQNILAILTRTHRRRLNNPELFINCPHGFSLSRLQRLIAILRLAILLHRGRSATPLPPFKLTASLSILNKEQQLTLKFPENWLEQHPLTQADLEQEKACLRDIGIQLQF